MRRKLNIVVSEPYWLAVNELSKLSNKSTHHVIRELIYNQLIDAGFKLPAPRGYCRRKGKTDAPTTSAVP